MGNGIGWAVEQISARRPRRVRRAGWNGKGMWIELWTWRDDTSALPFVVLRTATGQLQPGWVCSQADLLATDWELVAPEEQPDAGV